MKQVELEIASYLSPKIWNVKVDIFDSYQSAK
jgi:hypothetical protein